MLTNIPQSTEIKQNNIFKHLIKLRFVETKLWKFKFFCRKIYLNIWLSNIFEYLQFMNIRIDFFSEIQIFILEYPIFDDKYSSHTALVCPGSPQLEHYQNR